jgi:hypothetical protein
MFCVNFIFRDLRIKCIDKLTGGPFLDWIKWIKTNYSTVSNIAWKEGIVMYIHVPKMTVGLADVLVFRVKESEGEWKLQIWTTSCNCNPDKKICFYSFVSRTWLQLPKALSEGFLRPLSTFMFYKVKSDMKTCQQLGPPYPLSHQHFLNLSTGVTCPLFDSDNFKACMAGR